MEDNLKERRFSLLDSSNFLPDWIKTIFTSNNNLTNSSLQLKQLSYMESSSDDIWSSFLPYSSINFQGMRIPNNETDIDISLLNVDSLLSFMDEEDNRLQQSKITKKSEKTSIEELFYFNANWENLIYVLQQGATKILQSPTSSSTLQRIQVEEFFRQTFQNIDKWWMIQQQELSSSIIVDLAAQLEELRSNLTSQAANASVLDYLQELSFTNTIVTNGYFSLFKDYPTITNITQDDFDLSTQIASLSENIYHPERWEEEVLGKNYAIVANGTVSNVNYLVTDSVMNGNLVRTITLKGFDATDDSVDREVLLKNVITAFPLEISVQNQKLQVHSGLFEIAEQMYNDLSKTYIDTLGKSHKLILNGHSIGGSLSILLLIAMCKEKGPEYVKQKVQKVFSFGSPCVILKPQEEATSDTSCPILASLQLPSDLIYSFAQPWDPIVRLFTAIDPLYPLVDDLGDDGVTPYVSGPPRTLRPIVKTIVENWASWPSFRQPLIDYLYQNYIPCGTFYLLLPDPVRYVTDRLFSVYIGVPPLFNVIKLPIGGDSFLKFLDQFFPLSVLRVSTVPAALRSFIHHFYPAYSTALQEFELQQVTKPITQASSVSLINEIKKAQESARTLVESEDIVSEDEKNTGNVDLNRIFRLLLQNSRVQLPQQQNQTTTTNQIVSFATESSIAITKLIAIFVSIAINSIGVLLNI